jgi:sugar phosphate isomerase/epimerase
MRIGGDAHLTYCTNVHPGEHWADVEAMLLGPVAEVARRVSRGQPFGVGLRLASAAARELRDPALRERLVDVLRTTGMYVFTVNAFPYGAFHETVVKGRVYRPDWRESDRLVYTRDVADLLAAVLPDGITGTISTLPGSDGARADRDAIAENLLRAAADLVDVERRTGKRIVLALEPEPTCMLEAAVDTASFFRDHLFTSAAFSWLARAIRTDTRTAERALRRHLGVCVDACHLAVAFEAPGDSLAALEREGIAIAKVQVSAGLEVRGAVHARELLPVVDDGIYLHQTAVAATDGALRRFRDLDEALAAGPEGVWRVHAHVPVHRDPVAPLGTTRPHLEMLLDRVRRHDACSQFEVETYTWSVLPSQLRGADLVDDVAGELAWTRRILEDER